VLNDHDAAGAAHAQVVCKLSIGVAKSVKRLKLTATAGPASLANAPSR
jgi:hypothetical protein